MTDLVLPGKSYPLFEYGKTIEGPDKGRWYVRVHINAEISAQIKLVDTEQEAKDLMHAARQGVRAITEGRN